MNESADGRASEKNSSRGRHWREKMFIALRARGACVRMNDDEHHRSRSLSPAKNYPLQPPFRLYSVYDSQVKVDGEIEKSVSVTDG